VDFIKVSLESETSCRHFCILIGWSLRSAELPKVECGGAIRATTYRKSQPDNVDGRA
jgi:hypothetical protein